MRAVAAWRAGWAIHAVARASTAGVIGARLSDAAQRCRGTLRRLVATWRRYDALGLFEGRLGASINFLRLETRRGRYYQDVSCRDKSWKLRGPPTRCCGCPRSLLAIEGLGCGALWGGLGGVTSAGTRFAEPSWSARVPLFGKSIHGALVRLRGGPLDDGLLEPTFVGAALRPGLRKAALDQPSRDFLRRASGPLVSSSLADHSEHHPWTCARTLADSSRSCRIAETDIGGGRTEALQGRDPRASFRGRSPNADIIAPLAFIWRRAKTRVRQVSGCGL